MSDLASIYKHALQEIETLAFHQYLDWMHFHELAMVKPFEAEVEAQEFARRVSTWATIALGAESAIEVVNEDDLSVLGRCPHGIDLDREFCPEGCRA